MAGGGSQGGQDDWFVDPERATRRAQRPAAGGEEPEQAREWPEDEDWLAGGAGRDRISPLAARLASPRARIGLAVALVAVLVIGLALGGVFSGGHKSAPVASTTAPQTTTTASTTTTTTTGGNAALPTVALKPGDTGAQVKKLQRTLAKLGYAPGAIDGGYGPSTQKAVAAFQTAQGLAADGVFGPKTLDALLSVAGP
jgi:hypothetical protein